MKIAVTADLHWGHNPRGDQATRLLVEHLLAQPPDLLIVAGDVGTDHHFCDCLALLRKVACPIAVIAGNHDVWVVPDDHRGHSLDVFDRHLPAVCQQHGVTWLEQHPLLFPSVDLAIVGTMNWYDYSWSLPRLIEEVPNAHFHLATKTFSRGRHNDGKFVRWPTDDTAFTERLVNATAGHVANCLQAVGNVMLITHHPAFRGIAFPRANPPQGLDQLLWDALSGNRALEDLIRQQTRQIPLVISGHTHRSADAMLETTQGYNVGGDYHFKRLLVFDWPHRDVETHVFGDPKW